MDVLTKGNPTTPLSDDSELVRRYGTFKAGSESCFSFSFLIFSVFLLQGLPRNILDEGPFLDTPDWSFADGRPGIPRFDSFINYSKSLFCNIADLKLFDANPDLNCQFYPDPNPPCYDN